MKFIVLFMAVLAPLLVSAAVWAKPQAMSFSQMSRAERSYYEQVYDYSMTTTKPGESYDWRTQNAAGRLTIGEAYTSKSGSLCRNFNEYLNIRGQMGQVQGVGCKRAGSDGWCKLKPGNALTCSMEKSNFYGVHMPSITPYMPDVSVTMGGGGREQFNGGGIGPTTNINGDFGRSGGSKNIKGSDVADTVTGAAGSTTAPVTQNLKSWFQETFGE